MKYILIHKKFIKQIKSSKQKYIVFGLSETTKYMLKKYKFLRKKITHIVDKNHSKLSDTYLKIPIISYNYDFNDTDIILWGNHVSEGIVFLKKFKCNIWINYTYAKTSLLHKDFLFTLEFPAKTASTKDINQQFAKVILKKLLKFYRPIHIKQIEFNTQYHKQIREIKNKHHLVVSYHSIGQHNKQILRWKEGYLHNMVTFDKKGYSGWSSLCDKDITKILKKISQKKADKYFKKISTKHIQNNQSKYIQPNIENFNFPKKFIFFPLQTLNDSVMQHSYFKPFKLIKNIIKILNKQNIPLVVKQHPKCQNQKLKKYLKKQAKKDKITLFDGSIHDAISKATTIYTINSGVGFEALLHLKPIVTFGKSDYMSMTKNINNLNMIKTEPFYFLKHSEKLKIKKFLYYYINKKSLFLNDKKGLEKMLFKLIKENADEL